MEAGGIKQEDLVSIFGSTDVVLDIVKGKNNISRNQAKALSEFFAVDVRLFLENG